jgi:hypothetical protein
MSYPLVLALFQDRESTLTAARTPRGMGIDRACLSLVSRTHQDEGVLAEQAGATPGVEIEDSRPVARLGELGGYLLAALAFVLPGIGPIVSAGPMAADLGEAAGHMAGGVASILERAGMSGAEARRWQAQVEHGALLLGVHASGYQVEAVLSALEQAGAGDVTVAAWHHGCGEQAGG